MCKLTVKVSFMKNRLFEQGQVCRVFRREQEVESGQSEEAEAPEERGPGACPPDDSPKAFSTLSD